MLHVLNDERKFCKLGKLPKYDRTSATERDLQSFLLKLNKSNPITEEFYKQVRPIGSEGLEYMDYQRSVKRVLHSARFWP